MRRATAWCALQAVAGLRPRRPRRVYTVLIGTTLWLAACSSTQWVYDKRDLTPAKLDHDMADCRKESNDPQVIALPGNPRVDRALFNRCMERKGYTVRKREDHE